MWPLVSLQIGVAATFNSLMLVLIHRWAIIPTWLLFILLGNTSSGGAVSASLLPQPFAFFNHALPSGASVSAIHAATYFPDHQRVLPFVVLGGWLVVSMTALVVVSKQAGPFPGESVTIGGTDGLTGARAGTPRRRIASDSLAGVTILRDRSIDWRRRTNSRT